METEDVQSANTTERRRRAPTEVARVVAADRNWGFTWDGTLVDDGGITIAATIEDAARAMVSLGWVRATISNFADWTAIPHVQNSVSAADAIRAELAYAQKPDRIPPGGAEELIKLLDLTEVELEMLRGK